MGYHVTNVITSRRMFLQSKNHWNVLCKGKTDQCATYRFFFQSMLLPFVTFWKLFKMLLCNAKLCITSLSAALGTDFVGQAEQPQFHEPKFASPGEILNGT